MPQTGKIARRTRDRHSDVHLMLAEGPKLPGDRPRARPVRNLVRRFAPADSAEELLVNDGTGVQGYVRQYFARFRGNAAAPQPQPAAPKGRTVTSSIMSSPANLADADSASVAAILAVLRELAAVIASVRTLAALRVGIRKIVR